MLHETYEIIHETLWDMNSGDAPDRNVCREAERFAAAVLMQPRAFEPLALEFGLDVPALQRAFRCSYASVTIRLAEVLRRPPLMAVLYEREDDGDPAGWTEPPELSSDGGAADAGLRDARPPSPSPASGAASPGGADLSRTAPWPSRPPAPAGRSTPRRAAWPSSPGRSIWKERLAKVVVIAVPDRDGAVLDPQVIASDVPGRRRRPVPTVAAVGPWQRSKAGSPAIGADVRTA